MKTASTPATMTSFSSPPPNPPEPDGDQALLQAKVTTLFLEDLQRRPGGLAGVALATGP